VKLQIGKREPKPFTETAPEVNGTTMLPSHFSTTVLQSLWRYKSPAAGEVCFTTYKSYYDSKCESFAVKGSEGTDYLKTCVDGAYNLVTCNHDYIEYYVGENAVCNSTEGNFSNVIA